MRAQRFVACLGLTLVLLSAAVSAAPYTLEELFTPPWPFGRSHWPVALSDDGCYLACGWNAEGLMTRDLWAYDVEVGQWYQRTDLRPEREARRRREFDRDLMQERQEWEEEHAKDDEGDDADAAGENADESTKVEEFDESERIEEFEKDLKKELDEFGGVSEVVFRRGAPEVFWIFEGAVYSLDLADPLADVRQRLRHEQGFYHLQRVDHQDVFLLTSDSDVFLWWPVDGRLRQLTSGGCGDFDNASYFAISNDLRWLATVQRDYTSVRKQRMPDLLAEDPFYTEHYHVRPADTPESVKLLLFDLSETPPWPVEVEMVEEPFYQVEYMAWSPAEGDQRLLFCTISGDGHDYRVHLIEPLTIAEAGDDEYTKSLIYREQDDAWINWARTRAAWAFDGKFILQSEYEGLAGVYRLAEREVEAATAQLTNAAEEPVEADNSAAEAEDEEEGEESYGSHVPQPLYAGESEVVGIRPLKHSANAFITHLYPDPATCTLGLLNLDSGALTLLTPSDGWCHLSAVNDKETLLAYSRATAHQFTELALVSLPSSDDSVALAEQVVGVRQDQQFAEWVDSWDVRFITVPIEEFTEYEEIYREPGTIEQGEIAVKLWLPPGWERDGSYPLLVWAHGAGYAQTVRREADFLKLFHPWVADELGWIVAEVDYRGSAGYGRDWRIDVWGRLGHPETDDLVAVKRYLVEHYGADSQRTALWGWSYGGFLTLMAMGLAPDQFPVGCAVAPVNRWENYFYWYSRMRLGDPAEHEEEYDRSAPETYLEYVTGDVLIIHGLRDDNTLFQSVAQYLEKGHEEGINVELKLFPSDAHGISNEFHYVRVFEAIVDFCQDHWPVS